MSRVVAEGRAVDPGHGVCLPGIRAQLYDSGQLPDASDCVQHISALLLNILSLFRRIRLQQVLF